MSGSVPVSSGPPLLALSFPLMDDFTKVRMGTLAEGRAIRGDALASGELAVAALRRAAIGALAGVPGA